MDACDWGMDDAVPEEVAESCSWAPPPRADAVADARPHLGRASPLAALPYSASSTTLSKLTACGEEEEPCTPPELLSPALQASVAAWHSATSLMQELSFPQQHPPLALPPGQLPLPGEPRCGSSPPLTPEQLRELQPGWLRAALAQQGGEACEACSPDRQLLPASAAATNTAAPPPLA